MILRDLISEVSSLGFDGVVECDTLFLTALRRSLYKIFTDKKITSEIVLHKSKERISDFRPILRYNGEDEISLPLRGRAVSFYTSGKGTYTIIHGSRSDSYGFLGSSSRHAHRLNSTDGKIVFSGSGAYTVSSFSVFLDAYSSDCDIPDGKRRQKYDIRAQREDFFSFASFPTDDEGRPLEAVTLGSGCIYVDAEYEGDIYIRYTKLPRVTMEDSLDSEVDIPREYEHLLAVLVASHVFVDSNSALAEHYGELYSSMANEILPEPSYGRRSPYNDTNGWA
ncbi:MAG: hypothetical protein J6Q85_03365 [Clostridia bacterium]|nr:hypothetical protein [Clostridia bacterium]